MECWTESKLRVHTKGACQQAHRGNIHEIWLVSRTVPPSMASIAASQPLDLVANGRFDVKVVLIHHFSQLDQLTFRTPRIRYTSLFVAIEWQSR
jgi:hypothetical protein